MPKNIDTRRTLADFDHNDITRPLDATRRAFNALREACPVGRSDRYGGFDIVCRYADARGVLSDADHFSSADGGFIPPSGLPPVPALDFDEPEHTQWRELMEPPLTLRAVRDLTPALTQITDRLIDRFAGRGTADLVADLAEPLPSIVVGRMVGLDEQHSLEGADLGSALFESIGTPQFSSVMADFVAFTEHALEERRRHPRDDFLTEIASGRAGRIPLDAIATTSLLIAYLVGGHHSTEAGLVGLFRHVFGDPEIKQRLLTEPGLISRAVDESLRLTTPLQTFARTVTSDTTVGDQPLSSGRRILLNLAAANRDPRRFNSPDEFDFDRMPRSHLAFGCGPHVCLGQHLARAEMRVALEHLLLRLPDIRIEEPVTETLAAGSLVVVPALPVVFTARA